MSGSTYGRTVPQPIPLLVVLAVALPLLVSARRELDVLAFTRGWSGSGSGAPASGCSR